jgi:hypothetical protein
LSRGVLLRVGRPARARCRRRPVALAAHVSVGPKRCDGRGSGGGRGGVRAWADLADGEGERGQACRQRRLRGKPWGSIVGIAPSSRARSVSSDSRVSAQSRWMRQHWRCPTRRLTSRAACPSLHHLPTPQRALCERDRVLVAGGVGYAEFHLYTSVTGSLEPRVLRDRPGAPAMVASAGGGCRAASDRVHQQAAARGPASTRPSRVAVFNDDAGGDADSRSSSLGHGAKEMGELDGYRWMSS